jgi:aminoglycoside phosphotransferase (APT) family kinase protein
MFSSVMGMTPEGEATDSEVLVGGMVNAGAVLRRGALVERPAPPHAIALHAHLLALREHGFDAAPVPVGLTADGREQVTFVPGDVALPPFPHWVMTRPALRSVGSLLRRLHESAAAVAVDTRVEWPQDLADPEGGTMLCHNDVCPENVVFRDGRAVALIDFDLAAPGRPLWDVAMTARYWVPMLDPLSATASYPDGLDAPARLRILADSATASRRRSSANCPPSSNRPPGSAALSWPAAWPPVTRCSPGHWTSVAAGTAGTGCRHGWSITVRRSRLPC